MRGKKLLAVILAGMVSSGIGSISYAATAQDVINLNQASYTAGTRSVYGPSLSQAQLNAVAQAAADFKTNYINDGMDNDAKIRAAYDYLVSHVSYIDWDKGEAANTAYGALIRGQAACSGYARAFKALCDAMGVSCYYIHATDADHQWNLVEFDDGYYFVDVEANDSSGFDWIYHAPAHMFAYDTAQFSQIGSKSGQNTAGTAGTDVSASGANASNSSSSAAASGDAAASANTSGANDSDTSASSAAASASANTSGETASAGWRKDAKGWWWQNADGTYPAGQWMEINGKQYYFGSDGYMYADRRTPDGYLTGSDGAWIQNAGQIVNARRYNI